MPAVPASERAGSVAHAAAAAGQLEVLQLLGERCELDELVDEEGGGSHVKMTEVAFYQMR